MPALRQADKRRQAAEKRQADRRATGSGPAQWRKRWTSEEAKREDT